MKNTFTLFIALLLSVNGFSQKKDLSEHYKPKAIFQVQVNNKEYVLSEGEELRLDSTISQNVISIKLASYKIFNIGSISFKYPSNYSFKQNESGSYRTWSLDESAFNIQIMEFDERVEHDDLIDEMLKLFKELEPKVEEIEMSLGGRKMLGKRISSSIIGQEFTMDMFNLFMPHYKTKFITFYNTLDKDGKRTKESKTTLRMINNTFKYK